MGVGGGGAVGGSGGPSCSLRSPVKLEPVVTRGPHRLPLQLRGGLRCGRSCLAFVVGDHQEKASCLETFVGGGEGSGVQRRREKLEKAISEKLDLF